jgi:phosphatidylinositol glycan class B
MGLNCLIDSFFYGRLILTPYNFLLYNVFHNVGIHYGAHHAFWYWTEGVPTLLFAHIPLFLVGLKFKNRLKLPLCIIIFNITFYR